MFYISDMMAKEIQAIMDRIQTWPAEKQQLAYDLLIWIEGKEEDDASDLTAEDWADLEEGLAEADRGEFVPEEEMKALFDSYLWPLTPEERTELEEAQREIERGEVASDEEVARIFRLGRR